MIVKKLAHGIILTVTLNISTFAAEADKIGSGGAGNKTPILWRDPHDIASRNLFFGPGGESHQPHGPYKFVKEDLDGTNPKFVVHDRDGVKWKVKLGGEGKPETVASRIAWAVGFYTNEDYFLHDIQVKDMPARLHRGQNLVAPGATSTTSG